MVLRITLIAILLVVLPTTAYFIWFAPHADDYRKQISVPRDPGVESQVREDLRLGNAYVIELQGKKGTYFNLVAYLPENPTVRATIIARWKSESFQKVYAGPGDPPCDVVSAQSVPMAIAPACIEKNGSQVLSIDRTNPLRGILSRFFPKNN